MEKKGICLYNQSLKSVFCIIFCTLFSVQSVAAEDWITEEVLKQLSEVRQDLKGLKDEVRSLKELMAKPDGQAAARPKAGPIDIKSAPFVGDGSAEVAIIEFSDYQCPYCRRHYKQTYPDIKKSYVDTGKVKYVMKQFPLGFHAKARGASVAALCVEKYKKGKYIEAHKSIFEGSTSLDQSSYLALAESLGISTKKYESCLNDPEMSKIVDQDMAQGKSAGISGTPAFLVGKIKDGKLVDARLITGARPFSSFSSALDSLL